MMDFVETPTARTIFQEVEFAVSTGNHCLITGRAGVGKTAALTELARRDRRAAYMTMLPAQASLRGVIRAAGAAFGHDCTRQHIYQIDEDFRYRVLPLIVEQERYLIVDEAQMLPLLAVRQLQAYADHAQLYGMGSMPIVFAGNEFTLKRTRANAEGHDQIISRIGNGHRPLHIKGISAGDVEAFCVEFAVEGMDAYAVMRDFGKGRNCRVVLSVLEEAQRLAGAKPVRVATIREALLSLHGPEAVKVVPLAAPPKRAKIAVGARAS
jgi:hypothetical protein